MDSPLEFRHGGFLLRRILRYYRAYLATITRQRHASVMPPNAFSSRLPAAFLSKSEHRTTSGPSAFWLAAEAANSHCASLNRNSRAAQDFE